MATSVPRYYMYIDFKADAYTPAKDAKYNWLDTFKTSKKDGVDSLAFYLSRKLKDRTPAGYKAYLLKGLSGKSRQFPIYAGKVSYSDLKEIRKFPFLRLGRYKSGFYTKEMVQRQKPFGTLASRTIGDIYGEIEEGGTTKGKNGLELQYDSLLRGQAGLSSVRRVGGGWTNVIEVDPVDGMDIRTTIDINIQDITEKSLVDKLKAIDAESGTAVVMEVETGEIKAITNMGRIREGVYGETKNHAVADEIEPGSTFKVASIMVALEDGLCNPGDTVDVGNGIYMYKGARMTDHNMNKGGYCLGHGLGLHLLLRQFHLPSFPDSIGHKFALPVSPAASSQRHRPAPETVFPPEASPVSAASTAPHFQCHSRNPENTVLYNDTSFAHTQPPHVQLLE